MMARVKMMQELSKGASCLTRTAIERPCIQAPGHLCLSV